MRTNHESKFETVIKVKKQGRNEICECGSGKKYKRCCIAFETRIREPLSNKLYPNKEDREDLMEILNFLSQSSEGLRIFCKEEGFYYFQAMTIAQKDEISQKFENNTLKKEDFFEIYKKHLSPAYVDRILFSLYCDKLEPFTIRKKQLKSTFSAYFSQQYDLAIISAFVLIEGILRDIGKLGLKNPIKPTIPKDKHEQEGRYHQQDSIGNFNAFITKLFKGNFQGSELNRNTILHGYNLTSFTQENALVLILTLLEIGNYMFSYENFASIISGKFDLDPYIK